MVINLFGAPGAGKSTGAAYIFAQLKMRGVNAELVSEFAKDKGWEESKAGFQDQLYILGKQHFKISKCYDKVDVVVTDSPLLLSSFYNSKYKGVDKGIFDIMVSMAFKDFENNNYLIKRVKGYNPIGRFQTEYESDQLADDLKNMLDDTGVKYLEVPGSIEGYDKIVNEICSLL